MNKNKTNHMSVYYDGYRERNPIKWVKRYFRQIKWAHQRATRGFADCDSWDIRAWFLGVMPDLLDHYANNLHSIPSTLDPSLPHWTENKAVVFPEDLSDDPDDDLTYAFNAWKNTIMEMAEQFREADEEKCKKKNPLDDEFYAMYEEFSKEYGTLGRLLETDDEDESGAIAVHFPSEVKEEWAELTERYVEEEKKLDEYRKKSFDEAITSFKDWFWDLWD